MEYPFPRTHGKAALPSIISAMKNEDPFVRNHALIALEMMGPNVEDAIPNLIEALKDKESIVRFRATTVLGNTDLPAVPALSPYRWGLEHKKNRRRHFGS